MKYLAMIMFSVLAFADMKVERKQGSLDRSPVYKVTRTKMLKKRDGTAVEVVDPNATTEFEESEIRKQRASLKNRMDKLDAILVEIEKIKAAK